LFFRQRLFADIFESQVQGPFTIIRFEQGNNSKETFVYLEMPNIVSTISSISSNDWKFTVEPVLGFDEPQKVVKKSSQKIEELIDYVERQSQDIQEHVIYDSLKHFINRAVCVPIVGDPALRNILIDISQSTHRAVNIDFEDNRTVETAEKIEKKRTQNDLQSSEESTVSIFFKLLIGNKLWGAKKIEFFVKMMLKNPAIIRQHFDFIKQKLTINESREMIESFAKTYKFTECNVDQMTRRCQEILKVSSVVPLYYSSVSPLHHSSISPLHHTLFF
jgi:hypothetical protein